MKKLIDIADLSKFSGFLLSAHLSLDPFDLCTYILLKQDTIITSTIS